MTINLGMISMFGEYARTGSGGSAWVAGAVVGKDSTLQGSIACRDYGDDFDNVHAHAYGVQTSTSNERGIAIGWSVQLTPGLIFRGYADQSKIPSSTYSSLLPRSASELLVEIATRLMPGLHAALAVRTRRKDSMQSATQADEEKNSARFAGRLDLTPRLILKARYERVIAGMSGLHQEEKGDMVSQALCYNDRTLQLECGAAFFDSDLPLYDMEGNLRGCISSPALYGKGSRWRFLCAWSPGAWGRIAAKYGVIVGEKRPVLRELGVQVEVRY